MYKYIITSVSVMVLALVYQVQPAQAVVSVAGAACSNIDVTDGSGTDWTDNNIPFLAEDDPQDYENPTCYYSDGGAWQDEEFSGWRYRQCPDLWVDIKDVALCNTPDLLKMYYRSHEPMMTYYDKQDDLYYDTFVPFADDFALEEGQSNEQGFADDFFHWMAWKFQKVEPDDSQIYWLAVNIEIGDGNQPNEDFPQGYLFKESTSGVSFEDATLNPTELDGLNTTGFTGDPDTLIKEFNVHSESQELIIDGDEITERSDLGFKSIQGFEVAMPFANVLDTFDMNWNDLVNIGMMVYSDPDSSDIEQYRFTKAGPRSFHMIKGSKTTNSLRVAWKRMSGENIRNYQALLLNSNSKKISLTKNIKRSKHKFTDLESGVSYKVRVRAKRKNGTNTPWSETLNVTTQ